MVTDDFLDDFAGAVREKVCSVSACQTDAIAVRNGRALCGKHRDRWDHGTSGEPCKRCGSREWVATPDGESVAICAMCELVVYDEGVIEHSW